MRRFASNGIDSTRVLKHNAKCSAYFSPDGFKRHRLDESTETIDTDLVALVSALLSLARSSQLGIILATQDTASLTNEVTKKLVLANTRTKFLMTSEFPEDVATLAGTMYQLESSIQHEDGELTGLGSARVQHAFKVEQKSACALGIVFTRL